ncbi:1-deoxy-D-xylulose-5-phosphate synthase [Malacoplasma iowae]|uniref:1-deoxy-D-xylulose-5-phosphate synthase n=1 Tax=Malacoplasma iowae TaxID=2116 RepID=UPI002A187B5C|nr:1-deoxy-D-xylulose-5-phosphate synthase [Malacoplasma iowae]WPL37984.1 1-deoxy-D-xylulose-5-phosphate synthase [Malacoplasma iowae]
MSKFIKYDEITKKSIDDLKTISKQIRKTLIELSKTDSIHLSSNLGIVEISIALLYCFNSPKDKIIYDTGHQCYVHKILTDRWDKINTIRKSGGLSGFFEPLESEHDFVSLGHSGTCLSLASAIANNNLNNFTIAVIGDAVLNSGISFEALNDIGCKQTKIIIVINDNGMSISKNVGAINNMFNTNDKLVKSFFNALKINYLGPYNGNDLSSVIEALNKAKKLVKNGPVVLHLKTIKGLGLKEAENDLVGLYHSNQIEIEKHPTYGKVAANKLSKLLECDNKIKIINPAMTLSTGFLDLSLKFKDNYEDVGIAEEHAVTKASGYSLMGFKTFVVIYSTFLQRTYDQIIHDISRLDLPVTFLIDRADISYGDGNTHHGIYDVGFIKTIPKSIVANASNNIVLSRLIDLAYDNKKSPFFIRYTKDQCEHKENYSDFNFGDWVYEIDKKSKTLIISYGHLINEIKNEIDLNKYDTDLVNAIFVTCFDRKKVVNMISKYKKIFVFEKVYYQNNLYDDIARMCFEEKINVQLISISIKNNNVGFGSKNIVDLKNNIDVRTFFKKYFN